MDSQRSRFRNPFLRSSAYCNPQFTYTIRYGHYFKLTDEQEWSSQKLRLHNWIDRSSACWHITLRCGLLVVSDAFFRGVKGRKRKLQGVASGNKAVNGGRQLSMKGLVNDSLYTICPLHRTAYPVVMAVNCIFQKHGVCIEDSAYN